VGELHFDTPSPHDRPVFISREFDSPRPAPPERKHPSFFGKFFKRTRKKIDAENQRAAQLHEALIAEWQLASADHRKAECARRTLIEERIYTEVEAMESHLEDTLQDIAWPRETPISVEIEAGGRVVFVDVDLPEIEDMPSKTAGVPTRGLKLSVKDMSPTQVQRLYMRHVHAVAFRIAGEAFAALPKSEQIVLSGFSQRRHKETGRMGDEYLFSLSATRQAWNEIEFSPAAIRDLDVVDALARFNLRRAMSKTGIFKPIAPFSPEEILATLQSPAEAIALSAARQ
jgi:hypothetical protein